MTSTRSFFLDISRFSAAFAVLLHHAFSPEYLTPHIYIDARKAVVIFFVISGFVIAYVAETSEQTWKSYLAARTSRIYSVAIPALLLTAFLDPIGMRIDPRWYVEANHSHAVIRLLMSAAFLNQSWNFTVTPLSNGPYWSLCYEVWYYVLFGIFAFDPNPTRRFSLAALAAIVAGPRILLMSVVWITGLICYKLAKRVSGRGVPGAILLLLAASNFAFILISGNPVDSIAATFANRWVNASGYAEFFGVRIFIGGDQYILADLYLAVSFGLVLLFIDSLAPAVSRIPRTAKLARMTAAHTFSLYLYHAPLLIFFAALTAHNPASRASLALIVLLTLVTVFALSVVTEDKRPALRHWLQRRLGIRQTRPSR